MTVIEKDKQAGNGTSWKTEEKQVLPKNRLGIVMFGLICSIFLAAMDQTIVATALPTITADLGGGGNYSWVGSAYLFAAAALSPLYGKLSDLMGRKPILYGCILIFLISSAFCGAAQNMNWLIVCRAAQGIGGGGIMQLVQIILADIVALEDRGKYGSLIGATWGIASVVGPILGGVFADKASWRWCFWINLPTGGIAIAVLFVFLNLNPRQGKTLQEHIAQFDFVGLLLLVAGVVLLLLGFHSSETTWSSVETISMIVIGVLLLVLFCFWEAFTKRSPIIPPRLFKTRTTTALLIITLLTNIAFFTGSYYLPLYFQVLGASGIGAGAHMIPYSLGTALSSATYGFMVSKFRMYRPIIWSGLVLFTVGLGLLSRLSNTSSFAVKVVFPLVTSIGLGATFQVPLLALQASMPLKDMATSTATFGFLRTLGGTIGISVGQVIYTSTICHRISKIPSLTGYNTSPASLNQSVRTLHNIPNVTLRTELIHAFAVSLADIWLVMTPIIGVCFFISLLIKAYPIKRPTVRAGDVNAAQMPPSPNREPEPAHEQKDDSAGLEKQLNEVNSGRLSTEDENVNGNQLGIEEV